jgi:hypothetical protein
MRWNVSQPWHYAIPCYFTLTWYRWNCHPFCIPFHSLWFISKLATYFNHNSWVSSYTWHVIDQLVVLQPHCPIYRTHVSDMGIFSFWIDWMTSVNSRSHMASLLYVLVCYNEGVLFCFVVFIIHYVKCTIDMSTYTNLNSLLYWVMKPHNFILFNIINDPFQMSIYYYMYLSYLISALPIRSTWIHTYQHYKTNICYTREQNVSI